MEGEAEAALSIIGWREWLALPDLGVEAIKAKVDSGARSSALHAFDIERFLRNQQPMVRFKLYPWQRDTGEIISAEAELVSERMVRNSGGIATLRPVILTRVRLLDQNWPIELTLSGRDTMGFRMLLGRQAIRGMFLINALRSYLAGKPDVVKRYQRARRKGRHR